MEFVHGWGLGQCSAGSFPLSIVKFGAVGEEAGLAVGVESKERTVGIDNGGGGGLVASRFGFLKVGMKNNVGITTGGPTDGFGVTPALMTDGDVEGERAGLQDTTFRAKGVDRPRRGQAEPYPGSRLLCHRGF